PEDLRSEDGSPRRAQVPAARPRSRRPPDCRLPRRRRRGGDSVLEVGGGVGAIQLELLKAGAAQTTNVELSPEYEPYAAELLGEDARVQRRVRDFVRDAAELEPADDVVLHRVVSCYPDPEALVGAAADHARRRLVLS